MLKNNKPRVLLVATFPPPVHGSSMVSMQIKESKVINEAFNVDYVNIGTSRSMAEIGKGGLLLNLSKFVRFIGAFLHTFWLLLIHRYDLCYCAITINGMGFLKDAPYVLLCHLFGRKIAIHQHNKGMSRFVDKPIYKWLYERVYSGVKVILLSEYLYEDISDIVEKQNVMVCANGIKPSEANSLKNKDEGSENDVPHILFLSNLIESKGCLVLLNACAILKSRGHNFFCDFIGGDTKELSNERFHKEIEKRGLMENVMYHGKKYGKDKDDYWAKANIFAFPTYYHNECFPLVLLEAMEKGVACISTIEGGIRDIIHDGVTGYTVERRNPQALADALEKLLLNPDLCRNMGEAGRKLYEERFTEERFERTMLECLKKSME